MLTSWLTFTAFVAASVNPAAAAALTFAPSRRVTSPPEAELTLKCGDDKDAGEVQFWHTPFGDLKTPGSGIHGDLDPAFVHRDGSLVIPNASVHHSGLYYCVLQHTGGATLWQYELHVGPHAGFRLRRDVGPLQEEGARVSDGTFAGAVAASVLLTFLCGFSAGALARSHVLRCLEAFTTRLRSPRQRQSDVPDHQSQATVTTLPPMYDNQSYETEQELRDESAMTPSPPVKPQRSFKLNREEEKEVEEEEEPETTAYLEGCDYRKEEEEEEEERESRGFYLLEDEGSQTETDEEKGGRESREEKREEEEEERESREERMEEEEEERESREERMEEDGRETREEKVEEEDGEPEMCRDSEQSSSDTEEEEEEPPSSSSSSRRPGRRVIRLYQYDDDGQMYSHLPDPVPADPEPAPRLKHRSLSLTRLSTIMAVASASPLDGREAGREESEESEERPHFHMEI